jgi:hypothetical protein
MVFVSGCSSGVVMNTLQHVNRRAFPLYRRTTTSKKMEALLNDPSNKQVTANLIGRLDIAKPVPKGTKNILGLLVDGSGKQVGRYGFGSPAPIYKYRLVLQLVSSVSVGQ